MLTLQGTVVRPVYSLADIRRAVATPGVIIESVRHWQKRIPSGHLRQPEKVQNNGFFYRLDGERNWCPYCKASELGFNEDGTVTFHPGHEHGWTFRFHVPQ